MSYKLPILESRIWNRITSCPLSVCRSWLFVIRRVIYHNSDFNEICEKVEWYLSRLVKFATPLSRPKREFGDPITKRIESTLKMCFLKDPLVYCVKFRTGRTTWVTTGGTFSKLCICNIDFQVLIFFAKIIKLKIFYLEKDSLKHSFVWP